jgi:hypothetical protein
MKVKNRVGRFDLHTRDSEMIGTRAWIYLAWSSEIDSLITVTNECASHGELKAQVELLKADLDALVQKAAQYF